MAILSRRRQQWDETLPDGRSVYEAVRQLSRGEEVVPQPTDRMSGVASPISRRTIETAPNEPGTYEPLARTSLSDTLPPPTIPDLSNTDAYQRDRTIRPHIDPAIRDPQAQLSLYEQDVRNYEPQKEGIGKTIARTALGFLQGGIPGAAYTAGSELLDRRQHDKDWQRREIAGADQQLQAIGARRREGMQEDLMQSQIDENQAQAIRAQREPLTRDPGFTLGEGQVRYDAKGNQIAARPGKAPSLTPHNPLLRERKNTDGSTTMMQSGDYGKTWTEAPNLGSSAPQVKPDESPKDIATRQRNFSAAQSKYKGLIDEEKAAARQKDAAYAAYSAARDQWVQQGNTNPDGQPNVIAAKAEADRAQAHYASFWGKKDAAKAEMLQHGDGVDGNGEPLPPKTVTRGRQSPVKPARDGKYHYTPNQIRTAAESSGKSYDEVLRQLKGRSNVIIDQ